MKQEADPEVEFVKCACQNCQGPFEIPSAYLGHQHECPHCHEETLVTEAENPKRPNDTKRILPCPIKTIDGEETILNEAGIIITKTRFISGGQTFAMSGIISLRTFESSPRRIPPIVILTIGALMAFFGFLMPSNEGGLFFLVAGILSIVCASVWMRFQKQTYTVAFTTSAGEISPYSTKNCALFIRISNALHQAIIARG